MMIDASVSYPLYMSEQHELLRQHEMRRVQLERQAESAVPGRMQRAISRLTATVRARRQPVRQLAPCPDPA